jgi:hypothetical protein
MKIIALWFSFVAGLIFGELTIIVDYLHLMIGKL